MPMGLSHGFSGRWLNAETRSDSLSSPPAMFVGISSRVVASVLILVSSKGRQTLSACNDVARTRHRAAYASTRPSDGVFMVEQKSAGTTLTPVKLPILESFFQRHFRCQCAMV